VSEKDTRKSGSLTPAPQDGLSTVLPAPLDEIVLRQGAQEISALDLVEYCRVRWEQLDPSLHALVHDRFDDAERDAMALDAVAREGGTLGPLHGIPIAVKDNIFTSDMPTSAQSAVRPDDQRLDATVVRRLREAGALIVGKASTLEYALGLPSPKAGFSSPRNPWDPTRWAGGSSSGSASGVAAEMFLGSLGTDTGGSIRLPAAWCGVTGLKPTFGLVPNTGSVRAGYDQDVIGPIARYASDCSTILQVICGADGQDPDCVESRATHLMLRTGNLDGIRVAADPRRLNRLSSDDVFVAFDRALDTLRSLGADVVFVELPLRDELTSASVLTYLADAASEHREMLDTRADDLGASTVSNLRIGQHATSGEYIRAQRIRAVGRRVVARLFDDFDFVVLPTASVPPPPEYEPSYIAEALFTQYWSALGNPVVSVPIGYGRDGLPIGMQIAGRWSADFDVLTVAETYQAATDFHLHRP
jgi:aspartyl-tRNA(Asn)/glutamyl-tRNA(Gln) amidotransferase subunit A